MNNYHLRGLQGKKYPGRSRFRVEREGKGDNEGGN